MFDYAQMGYWAVLPYQAIRTFPQLRLAPAGVVPQKEHHPRPIMDYSFYGTNQDCHPIAPCASMQFSGALKCLLQRLVYCNPIHGPPLMAKIDLSDGYYRVLLSPEAALHLAVIIPSDISTDTYLIALPLTLPMGWLHSPPYFCAYTETITDIANTCQPPPTHPLLPQTQCCSLPQHKKFHPSATILGSSSAPPLQYTDVYIDDFMILAQRPLNLPAMNRLLHTIDTVFHDDDTTNHRQIVSQSKIQKGDATFSTSKTILGWELDTQTMTLQLPSSRLQQLQTLLENTIHK